MERSRNALSNDSVEPPVSSSSAEKLEKASVNGTSSTKPASSTKVVSSTKLTSSTDRKSRKKANKSAGEATKDRGSSSKATAAETTSFSEADSSAQMATVPEAIIDREMALISKIFAPYQKPTTLEMVVRFTPIFPEFATFYDSDDMMPIEEGQEFMANAARATKAAKVSKATKAADSTKTAKADQPTTTVTGDINLTGASSSHLMPPNASNSDATTDKVPKLEAALKTLDTLMKSKQCNGDMADANRLELAIELLQSYIGEIKIGEKLDEMLAKMALRSQQD